MSGLHVLLPPPLSVGSPARSLALLTGYLSILKVCPKRTGHRINPHKMWTWVSPNDTNSLAQGGASWKFLAVRNS